jgi:hypothetical protein
MLWETGRREQSPGDKFRLDGTAGALDGPRTDGPHLSGHLKRRRGIRRAMGRAPCPGEPSATFFRFPIASYWIP